MKSLAVILFLVFQTFAREINTNGADPYFITEQRLREIRSEFMYPFEVDADYQEDIKSSIPQLEKDLNFYLPFFGFRYNYVRVSLNGYLKFSDPPEYFEYPLVFPVKNWPKVNDPAFIGVFYSKCRVGKLEEDDEDQREPGVYFRSVKDLKGRTDQEGVEIRERLKWDVREGIVGAENFDPKHAIIVTWKNVSFGGGIESALYKTNTFQVVLATDEVYTYVMFNYLNLDWTSHTEAGGDTHTGKGGVPAFIGFNGGNGTRSYEYHPYSQNSMIKELEQSGFGNGMLGRHFFRVDEQIRRGSCDSDSYGLNLPLSFAPQSGNMLGGQLVNITGPCFEPSDVVVCKFDTADGVVGTVVSKNQAVCIQPPLLAEGYVRLEVSVNGGLYKWKGKYFIETPATATQKIFFESTSYQEKSSSEIRILWNRHNLTQNANAALNLSLWGYRESNGQPEFLFIDNLAEDIQNTGSYIIIPELFKNRDNSDLLDIQFGFIQINTTEPLLNITSLIWSRPIPLAWYFGPQWERKYDESWAETLCDDWLSYDRGLSNFTLDLPECPCTLEHALANKGVFLSDFDCDKYVNPECYFNRGAVHCVRSGTPSLTGGEQQCCYDKNLYLMLTQDQVGGSYPRRSHNLGSSPWNKITKVPTLSQWYNDVVPRYVCCLWQEDSSEGCEALRYERRPSSNCVTYQAPGVGGVFGDPHIITFDNLEYTFNGKGEFALVHTDGLEVQARMEQMPENIFGETKATQLTSVVARGNLSTIVEVRQRPENARWRYQLDVFANGERIYFDGQSTKVQHFPGVTVYTPSYILSQSEVVIMFDSGAAVEVVENGGFLSTVVYLPTTFINETKGLLGNWSMDIVDDFVLLDNTTVSTNITDMERIYVDFGMKWMLSDLDDNSKTAALFIREYGRLSSFYNNKTFRPEFKKVLEDIIPQNRSQYIQKAYETCGYFAYECLYDFALTYDKEVARATMNSKDLIVTTKETNSKKIISCGVLETPRFGRKSTFLFVVGAVVTFECEPGFVLEGDQRKQCLESGEWSIVEDGPIKGCTRCKKKFFGNQFQKSSEEVHNSESYTWVATVSVTCSLLLLSTIVIIYCVYRHVIKKRTPRGGGNLLEEHDQNRKNLQDQEIELRPTNTSFSEKISIPISSNFQQDVGRVLTDEFLEQMINYSNEIILQSNFIHVLSEQEKSKNRFRTILPDTSQVFLPASLAGSSVYINAVTVDCYNHPKRFIVTQQPLPNTIEDFWILVLGYKINTIVSLNHEHDPHCPKFWPSTQDRSLLISNSCHVIFLNTIEKSLYSITKVVVNEQVVKIIRIKKWDRESTTPDSVTVLLKMWSVVKEISGQILVTCYDGATASGLFVALVYLVEKIDKEHVCDVFSAVKSVRKSRFQFVQYSEQVAYLYEAAVAHVQCFNLSKC